MIFPLGLVNDVNVFNRQVFQIRRIAERKTSAVWIDHASCCNSSFSLYRTLSMIFRSGDCEGHVRVLILFLSPSILHHGTSSKNRSIVLLKDVVIPRKMAGYNRPRVVF